jgi:prepilin-type N-terminal cleavage/methylation domain-containing protein
MKLQNLRTLPAPKGFSLVELLTVVAILGVLVGMLVPNLAISNRTRDVQNQRNAKTLISVVVGAEVAGVSLVVEGDLDATVARIIQGAAPTSGAFKDRIFGAPGMDRDAIEGAKQYLKVEGEQLVFIDPGSSHTTTALN